MSFYQVILDNQQEPFNFTALGLVEKSIDVTWSKWDEDKKPKLVSVAIDKWEIRNARNVVYGYVFKIHDQHILNEPTHF